MNTFQQLMWREMAGMLAERDLMGFLATLGRRTRSQRAVLYRGADEGTVVEAEWNSDEEFDSPDPTLRTLTLALDEPNLFLAVQRRCAAYKESEENLVEIGALLVEQNKARWAAQDKAEQAETNLQAVVQQRQEWEASSRTWQRRAEAVDTYSKGLTHHCLTHSRALTLLADAISAEAGFCPPTVAARFTTLKEVAGRSAELSEALMAAAKARAAGTNLELLPLAELFGQTRTEMQASIAAKKANITRGKLPTVVGDRQQWCSLLKALLTNAIIYSREGVQISLEVHSDLDEHHFILSDNGPGVPAKQREAAFEPFRRLHTAEEAPGVGLGLAMCRETVTQMGGRIWLSDTASGQGLAVHFTVPTHG